MVLLERRIKGGEKPPTIEERKEQKEMRIAKLNKRVKKVNIKKVIESILALAIILIFIVALILTAGRIWDYTSGQMPTGTERLYQDIAVCICCGADTLLWLTFIVLQE